MGTTPAYSQTIPPAKFAIAAICGNGICSIKRSVLTGNNCVARSGNVPQIVVNRRCGDNSYLLFCRKPLLLSRTRLSIKSQNSFFGKFFLLPLGACKLEKSVS